MMNDTDVQRAYLPKCYERVNMSSAELIRHLQSSEGPDAYSFATKLDIFPQSFIKHSLPLTPFMVLPPNYVPKDEHLHRQTFLWMSAPGTVTPSVSIGLISRLHSCLVAHFDLFHNFYVQIQGRKKFVLFPPAQWEQLYLYPILHPGGRSAQVQ